jgi:beta-N-acetylhexosaminidase
VIGAVRRPAALALVLALALAVIAGTAPAPVTTLAAGPTIAQLVGQKLIVAMDGTTTPSASLLSRIAKGEIGGVILFARNVTTKAALISLTAQLHEAAAKAGRPRLMVMVDQEGGPIKRIPWAPPTLSPPQMGALGSNAMARSQGGQTGLALSSLGIDVDLAPVADVPASTASFLYRQGRTWSFNSSSTAWLAFSFAHGLQAGHVIPAMKHFPGLGYATKNTDTTVVGIYATAAQLAPGLRPYQLAVQYHLPMVMLSNARYTAYDTAHAAGWSSKIINGLLRTRLGFKGVTITDALDGTAAARGTTDINLAEHAAAAGADMILITGSEKISAGVFTDLVAKASSGAIPLAPLQASYTRILALKTQP